MKMILKIFSIVLVLTIIISAQSKVGTTAANFLTIPEGSRAAGMGGAFVAVANDVTAAYWNPGGLSRLSGNEFSVTHAKWLVGTNLNWLGFVYKIDDDNAVAVSVNQLDYGTEDITTALEPMGTGEQWDAQDISVGLSYARNLTDRFSIGGTFKYIQQKIWMESASSYALDLGLLFKTQYDGLRIGMNIANFGTEMKLDGENLLVAVDVDQSHTGNNETIASALKTDSWPLPLMFTVGLALDPVTTENWNWTIATDAVYPNNQTTYLNLGTELMWNKILSLRVGYNSLFKEDAEQNLTAGIGVQYDLGGFTTRFDYSYMKFGVFSQISRFALTVIF
jgi:hypothetical protein